MKKALPATISCVLVLVALAAHAEDFWKHKSPQEWTAEEAVQVLRDSPWARQETVAASLANCDSDADGGDEGCRSGRFRWPRFGARRRELPSSEFNLAVYLVRWDSAPEVAAAFARLDSLGERALSAFQSPPPRRPADCYVVTMNVVRPARGMGDPFAIREKSKDKNPVRLKTSRGVFIPIESEHSGVGANEAVHFFFPREQDGKPVLDPAGDTAEFVFEGAKVSLKCKFSLDERAVR